MKVSEALASRMTCRAFLDAPVPQELVGRLLDGAARAPSGGNLQPWRVWALSGEPLASLKRHVLTRVDAGEWGEPPTEYAIYPPVLKEPYASRKFAAGEAMYAALGVARDDGQGRANEFRRNFEFFGAPVALILAIDREMQPGQWADVGMFMQSLMLLAREEGLDTAAIESWALFHRTLRRRLEIPDALMVFCAMALGRMDKAHPINQTRTPRAPLNEFATFTVEPRPQGA